MFGRWKETQRQLEGYSGRWKGTAEGYSGMIKIKRIKPYFYTTRAADKKEQP